MLNCINLSILMGFYYLVIMIEIVRFLRMANRLKSIKRRGWIKKVSVDALDAESVADHTYLTALISMLITDLKGLDTCKVLRMALLHDLAEAIVGDHTPEEISVAEKHYIEYEAMKELLQSLPYKIGESYMKIWDEYINNTSKEADILHQIDKFEMCLQAKEYEDKGYPHLLLKEFYDSSSDYIKDRDLLMLLNHLK